MRTSSPVTAKHDDGILSTSRTRSKNCVLSTMAFSPRLAASSASRSKNCELCLLCPTLHKSINETTHMTFGKQHEHMKATR